jgi:Tfp pilus assembly protein PilV
MLSQKSRFDKGGSLIEVVVAVSIISLLLLVTPNLMVSIEKLKREYLVEKELSIAAQELMEEFLIVDISEQTNSYYKNNIFYSIKKVNYNSNVYIINLTVEKRGYEFKYSLMQSYDSQKKNYDPIIDSNNVEIVKNNSKFQITYYNDEGKKEQLNVSVPSTATEEINSVAKKLLVKTIVEGITEEYDVHYRDDIFYSIIKEDLNKQVYRLNIVIDNTLQLFNYEILKPFKN